MYSNKNAFALGGGKSSHRSGPRTGSKGSDSGIFAHNGNKGKGAPKGGPRVNGTKEGGNVKWVERP